jgi:hypothetical protein
MNIIHCREVENKKNSKKYISTLNFIQTLGMGRAVWCTQGDIGIYPPKFLNKHFKNYG